MQEVGASVVVSGEVLGQRPASQKRRDLYAIAHHSGLEDRLLRPLSAKRLPPTLAEINGEVDRSQLYDFSGRSRKGLIALARQFGFEDHELPSPSTGCMLTETTFAPRVFDLLDFDSQTTPWDFELLKIGRHLRLGQSTKAVVGRRQAENAALLYFADRSDNRASAVLQPCNFPGPVTLLVGPINEELLDMGSGLIVRFSNSSCPAEPLWVQVDHAGRTDMREAVHHEAARAIQTI
jgi:hypothetical protein